MVGVVVEDAHPAGLAAQLEPARRAARTRRAPAATAARSNPASLERRERAGRVQAVVLTGNGEREVDRLELVAAHDPGVREAGEPLGEERLDLGARGERRVVVEVDVRDDGDLGGKRRRPSGRTRRPRPRTSRSPARAWPPSCGISPPIANDGSSPSRSRQKAIIAAVVVFPCAPETTIERRRARELGQEVGAGAPRDPPGVRRRDDGLEPGRRLPGLRARP